MKRIYLKEKLCNACRQCETQCKVAHSQKDGKAESIARLRVEQRGPLMYAFLCRHCDEPHCVYSCLTSALKKDAKTGLILHDAEKCVGCWTCTIFCPYGLISPDMERKIVLKCDLCINLDQPACVKSCTNRALVMVEEAGVV